MFFLKNRFLVRCNNYTYIYVIINSKSTVRLGRLNTQHAQQDNAHYFVIGGPYSGRPRGRG